MSSIKQKITRPYILLIVVMQVVILAVFNVTVTFYAYGQAEDELLKTVSRIELNLNNSNIFLDREDVDIGRRIAPNLMITSDSITSVLIQDGIYEQPPIPGQQQLPYDTIDKALELLDEVEAGEIVSFYINGQYYNAVEFLSDNISDSDKLIYISVGYFVDGFVDTINMILILISMVAVLAFIFVSNRLANGIATPIQRITKTVKRLKIHEVSSLDIEQSSDELCELTREINLMSSRIYNYDKSQKAFLHNASHELRTPLMSIQGYAEGLQEGVFTEGVATKVIINETQRLTDIVEELLTLVRIENYNAESPLQLINLSEYVNDIVESLIGVALKIEKELVTNFSQEDIFAYINPELLRQAMTNLISNGLRHADKTVTLHLFQTQESVFIYVEDDGCGIAQEDEEHIFERFYKGKGGNYGLGLSIVKTAIEQMKGKVRLKNSDKGAVFEIELKR